MHNAHEQTFGALANCTVRSFARSLGNMQFWTLTPGDFGLDDGCRHARASANGVCRTAWHSCFLQSPTTYACNCDRTVCAMAVCVYVCEFCYLVCQYVVVFAFRRSCCCMHADHFNNNNNTPKRTHTHTHLDGCEWHLPMCCRRRRRWFNNVGDSHHAIIISSELSSSSFYELKFYCSWFIWVLEWQLR